MMPELVRFRCLNTDYRYSTADTEVEGRFGASSADCASERALIAWHTEVRVDI